MSEPTNEPNRAGLHVPSAALWASAAVLVALILTNAARVNDAPAWAEMAVKSGGYSMMTTEAADTELLAVVDDRSENLLVYMVEPNGALRHRLTQPLPQMFLDARRQAGARP